MIVMIHKVDTGFAQRMDPDLFETWPVGDLKLLLPGFDRALPGAGFQSVAVVVLDSLETEARFDGAVNAFVLHATRSH